MLSSKSAFLSQLRKDAIVISNFSFQHEPVSLRKLREEMNTCHLAAFVLQTLPMLNPEDIQDVKTGC